MYSPRTRALLRSGRYSNIPCPTMARQRDQHHARPRGCPTRGSRGLHHPAQSPQGRPPAGRQTPGLRPRQNHLRAGGLPPGTSHALPDQMDQAPLAIHRDRALDLGHPHRPHTNRGRPRHAEGPPPRPQHSLTCGYHAIHRILRRVGLSPELAYPLPTTDQEVHLIRTLSCEVLAAAAEDGKLLLQIARPTKDRTGAPLQADTYTDTTPPPRNPGPCPSPPASQLAAHTRPPSRAAPGPATQASPTRPNNRTRAPRTQPPNTPHHPPHPATRTHPPQGAPCPVAHPPRPVTRTRPLHTPPEPQAHPPPRPLNAAHTNCSPPRTPTHTTSRIAGPRPSGAQKAKTAAPRLPTPLLPTRSARRAARSWPGPPSHPPPTCGPRTCPPSSPPWPQQKPPRHTSPQSPA